jgi:hypothetical protein
MLNCEYWQSPSEPPSRVFAGLLIYGYFAAYFHICTSTSTTILHTLHEVNFLGAVPNAFPTLWTAAQSGATDLELPCAVSGGRQMSSGELILELNGMGYYRGQASHRGLLVI